MTAVITRSLHPAALWPGVKGWFGLNYEGYDAVWKKIYAKVPGTLMSERFYEATSFGNLSVKPEGAPIEYDSDGQGYRTLVTPYTVAGGYQVTMEELQDNRYDEVSRPRAGQLAFALNNTIETSHAGPLLNGFTSYYTGDGVPLFSASHPTQSGGLQSNLPLLTSDFNEDALEDILQQIFLCENSRGIRINIQPKQIIVSAADMFNVTRVLQSELRSGSANNDINAIKNMNLLPMGAIVNPFLGVETTGAWYVQTNIPDGQGFVSVWRMEPELQKFDDFDTKNAKVSIVCRYQQAVIDWRSAFANSGV